MKRIKFIAISMILMFSLIWLTGCLELPVYPPTVNEHKITLTLEDGTIYDEIKVKDGTPVQLEMLSKEGHTFIGWYNEDVLEDGSKGFTKDVTLVGKFEINKYTYQFVVDGKVIKEETLEYGSVIEYPEDPVKDSFGETTYQFKGWDKDNSVLTENIIFTAQFETLTNQYTYQFVVDGKVIKEVTADHGSTIEYPAEPKKASTPEYSYVFRGWDKNTTTLTENIVFTAQFDSIINKYTYKFVDYDGTILKEETVDYNTMPIAPADPSRKETEKYEYTFKGWDKEITNITSNVIYTAQYNEIKKDLNVASLEGLKVSLLGDSITTFYDPSSDVNSYYGGENQFYYPKYGGIKKVEDTWWYSFILNNNMELGINNSWSGSCAYGSISSAGVQDARINTIDDKGSPDIVIIYLGTNDCASGYTVEQFADAIDTIIEKVNALTDADIFLMTLGYSEYKGMKYSDATRLLYNKRLREIAEEKSCGIIPLDEYVVEDNCSIYLADNLHYNAKGASLLSKITEKAVKEYYGIEFEGEIEVEHKEPLPEGVVGKTTVTTNGLGINFWVDASKYVFLVDSSYTFAQWSFRIQFSKADNGNYYVTAINPSGDSSKYDADYILIISEAHPDYKALVSDLSKVVVGCVVEFDESGAFPLEILFKENDGYGFEQEEDKPEIEEPLPEDAIAYITATSNTNFWGNYANNVFLIDSNSSLAFAQFSYRISLTKTADGKYCISALEESGSKEPYAGDYVIIFSEAANDAATYIETFKKLSIGDVAEFDTNSDLPVRIIFKAAK